MISIQSIACVNGKELQGKLIIDSSYFSFVSDNKIIFKHDCNWIYVKLNRLIEVKTKLFFIKTERIAYVFRIKGVPVEKILLGKEDEEQLIAALKQVKEVAIKETDSKQREERERQVEERKRQEELARQEAERKRREELARQEAECKRQEELARQEAERKKQEELTRQEAERKRQEELARQEAERKLQEEQERREAERERQAKLPFAELEIRFRQDDSYVRNINELLVGFFRDLFLCDDPYVYVEDNIDLYEKICSCIEENELSKQFSVALENIIQDAYECELSYEGVVNFIYSVCKAIEPASSAQVRDVYSAAPELMPYIEPEDYNYEDVKQAKKEERERRRVLYRKQYDKILAIIKEQKLPFSADYMMGKVSGANRNVFRDVVSNEEKVLNFYREYIWYDNLHVGVVECKHIRYIVRQIIVDRETHHISELYDQMQISDRDFLRDKMVTSPHRLFSIVQYICKDFAVFDRPYFAKKGARILNAKERIEKYVYGKKEVKVRQVLDYAQKNYMQIPNIIELLNGLNGTHLFSDKYTLIQYYSAGISYRVASILEELIREEVEMKRCIGICELTSYNQFPKISIPWNEWLVYSILLKWGSKFTVTTAGSTYKVAVPVIALKGHVTSEQLEKIAVRCKNKSLGSAMDISNVDAVLEDVLDDILDELEL